MTDKQLLKQLKNLQQITPSVDWKASQRDVLQQQIFNGQVAMGLNWTARFNLVMGRVFQPAVVAVIIFAFLLSGSLIGWYSGEAKPGDSLYIAKKLRERTEMTVALSGKAKTLLNIKFANERAKEMAQVMSEETDAVTKNDKVAVLTNNFKKEISQAKERLAKMAEPTMPEQETGEEVQFFSAGSNKDNNGIDIALPDETIKKTTVCSEDICQIDNFIAKEHDCTCPNSDMISQTTKVLEEVEDLLAKKDYDQVVIKLGQAEDIINQAAEHVNHDQVDTNTVKAVVETIELDSIEVKAVVGGATDQPVK